MRSLTPHRRAQWYAYAAVTSGVVLLFALAEWWTAKYVFDRSPAASTAIEIAIVLLAALVFQPFHRRAEAVVESVFSRRRRLSLEALSRFRRELTSFKDHEQLLRRVVEAVERHTETVACAVYVHREGYRAQASSFDMPAADVETDDPLVVRFRSTGSPAAPPALRSAAPGTSAFPMTVAGELIGFLCVRARFGELESEESQMLGLLAESLGLALTEIDPSLRAQEVDVPNNLPGGLPPLIGRFDEIAAIKSLLGQSRLVTLIGAGGVGKTRLAVHVASELTANRDGIWFVDLAPLDDPGLVASAIARVLEIADEGGNADLIDRIGSYLKTRQALILLDNCEHLIGAVARAAEHLLQRCPRITLLATSREPLGVITEEPYTVPSLAVPEPGTVPSAEAAMNHPAVMLFVARARNVDRAFDLTDDNAETVAEIVRRLDGIPMAIELAAPRLKVLSVEQLRARLDERFELLSVGSRTAVPRHQTLHALIAWSYDLLHEREKSLLRRCAIFRGDWPLDAAEALAAAHEGAGDWRVLDLVEALADKSLIAVQRQGASRRYRLLESTRQFALERLDEARERPAVSRRYAAHYARLAEAADAAYWQSDFDTWIAVVGTEVENYRGAIAAMAADADDGDAASPIVGNLRWFWYVTARREGRALVERARSALCPSAVARTRGLLALSAALLDPSAQALAAASEASALLREEDGIFATIEAYVLEATARGRAGQLAESCAAFDRAVARARSTREPRLIGWALGLAAYWRGASGDATSARALFDEAASVLHECGDAWQVARLQVHRAEFLFAQSQPEEALASVRAAESLFRARNTASGLGVALLNATAYLLALERYDEAWHTAREGLHVAVELDNDMARAWALGHLAELAAETGDTVRSARLLGHADAIYERTGGAREPTEQRGYERALYLLRMHLGEQEKLARMREGANTNVEIIAAEAMQIPQPRMHAPVVH